MSIADVNVTVSPEIIIKVFIDDKIFYGGVKVHISKTKPFSIQQCSYSATVLAEYIKKNVAKENEMVDPQLCLSIDIFAGRIVAASEEYIEELKMVRQYCKEVKQIWDKVA